MDFGLRAEVDEAEGSPSRVGANGRGLRYEAAGRARKIDRSADALRVCHHPSLFPPRNARAYNPAGVTRQAKARDMATKRSGRGAASACPA